MQGVEHAMLLCIFMQLILASKETKQEGKKKHNLDLHNEHTCQPPL